MTFLQKASSHTETFFDKKISETESLRNRIIVTLLENNYKIKEICDGLHISSKTLYRIKKKRAAKIGAE